MPCLHFAIGPRPDGYEGQHDEGQGDGQPEVTRGYQKWPDNMKLPPDPSAEIKQREAETSWLKLRVGNVRDQEAAHEEESVDGDGAAEDNLPRQWRGPSIIELFCKEWGKITEWTVSDHLICTIWQFGENSIGRLYVLQLVLYNGLPLKYFLYNSAVSQHKNIDSALLSTTINLNKFD